jgi:hypothetical protein
MKTKAAYMQIQKLTGYYVEAGKTRPQPPSKPADMEGTPWPLQPVKQTHRCKICSIVLNPGEPKICKVCTERPEGKALLSMPPNSGKHWTLEEDQQLRTLWEERSPKDIATALGRSIQSVLNRAHHQPDIRDFVKNNPDEVSFRNADKRFLIRILTTQDRLHPKR